MDNLSSFLQSTSNGPYAYAALFVAMILWGPPVTSAAAFSAAVGYLNVWMVLFISIVSSLAADVVHYAIGYWGRHGIIHKYGRHIGLTSDRISYLEKLARENAGKTITLSKIVPILAAPALIASGLARVPLRAYVWWCFIVTAPTSILFLIIGYYFGEAYLVIEEYLKVGGYFLGASIILFIITVLVWKKISQKVVPEDTSSK